MPGITVVSPREWLAARKELLVQETEAAPSARSERQGRPGGPLRRASPARSLPLHVRPGPGQRGASTVRCWPTTSATLSHLHTRNTTLILVSRAPWAKIQPFRARMGWAVPWYSSTATSTTTSTSRRMNPAPVMFNFKDKATLIAEGNGWTAEGEGAG